ncbi:DUF3617 domain-containing protein [Bacteriovorax sp. Seq25_V]|uniref:DUF3617 domain-containing protein n=1 Tax=Bacteriovorax sp. Seq25_V TaxID=1201288 RepID=UPI00038A24AC|nr:DUF3617 domain-containing protein [Bacteriovorax sp. Seq25_V]EQC47971.1 PF12276 family protein [Bacteriovorax sp. Seq25_V]
MKILLGFLIASKIYALDIKPGLWEQTVNLDAASIMSLPQVQAQIKNLPKEQAQMVLSMMASQMGPRKTEECITKEMLTSPEKLIPQNKDCKIKIIKNSADQLSTSVACEGKITGTATLKRTNTESYTGDFSGKDASGKNMKITFSGAFIKSNCK